MDKENNYSLNKDQAKIIALLGLGIGSFVVGSLPAFLNKNSLRAFPLTLTGLLCFGAGVLMATSLVHMLPEVRADLPGTGYAEITFCLGFIIVYLVDELLHYFCGEAIQHQHSESSHEHLVSSNPVSYGTISSPQKSGEIDCEHQHQHDLEDEEINARICHTVHVEPCAESSTGHVGLLVALSVHALLEGLAIGVQDSVSKVIILVTAVASHKFVVGFCLGVELSADPGFKLRKHLIAITVFSLGPIIGIGVGMSLVDLNPAGSLVIPILQGIAGGTLLYVTVCEVLPREKARWHQNQINKCAGICQLFSFVLGFGFMTFLNVFIKDGD